MNIGIIHQADVDAVWPQISKRIVECITRFGSDASAGDYWMMCRAGHAFLIAAHDENGVHAASIWRSETWVDGVVLKNLVTVGEDMPSWLPDMEMAARDLAISCGATSCVWQGREGWKHIFKDRAMTCHTLYRMEV
jgi:hypothetical protein